MKDQKFNKLFAYLISHEFKTPLTTIFGYAQMLQRKYDLDWNQEIVRQSIRLNLLLDQGVIFNRMYYKNLEFNKTNTTLSNVFDMATKKYLLAYPNSKVVKITKNKQLETDENKLAQVLLDLMFLAQAVEITNHGIEFKLREVTDTNKVRLKKILKGNWENISNTEEVGIWVDAQIIKMSGGELKLNSNSLVVAFG